MSTDVELLDIGRQLKGTLETLCEAGYIEYNFGASPQEAAGLIRFKESWGATPRFASPAG